MLSRKTSTVRFIVQQVLNSSVNFLDSIFVTKSWFGGQRVSDFSDHEDLLFGQLIEEAHSQQALRATAVPAVRLLLGSSPCCAKFGTENDGLNSEQGTYVTYTRGRIYHSGFG
jgi:hypothetical protein